MRLGKENMVGTMTTSAGQMQVLIDRTQIIEIVKLDTSYPCLI